MSRIEKVLARVHRPAPRPGAAPGYAGQDSSLFVSLRLDCSDGRVGWGFTGRFLAAETAHFLNGALGEALRGENSDNEGLVESLERRFNPRAMTGVVISALSTLDIALHDLRAQAAGVSVVALLGQKRDRVPADVTCGLPHLNTDALVEACGREAAAGVHGVKVLVGANGRSIASDADRVLAVRAAIGPTTALIVDANCAFELDAAAELARLIAPADPTWFEEPVRRNDVTALRALADAAIVPLGAGQMEQSADRFSALVVAGIDVIQPNVVFAGGFSAAGAAMRLARASGRKVAPAAGWDFINLHAMGAQPDGPIELHRGQAPMIETVLTDPPALGPDGALRAPAQPGLGYEIDVAGLAATEVDG